MREKYIKQVEKELHIPHKAKKEVVRDLNEIFASALENGETEQHDRFACRRATLQSYLFQFFDHEHPFLVLQLFAPGDGRFADKMCIRDRWRARRLSVSSIPTGRRTMRRARRRTVPGLRPAISRNAARW